MKVKFKSQLDLLDQLYKKGKHVSDGGWNVWKVNSGQLYQNDGQSNELPDWKTSYYEYNWEYILTDKMVLCNVSNNPDILKIRLIKSYDTLNLYKDTENATWNFAVPVENTNWLLSL